MAMMRGSGYFPLAHHSKLIMEYTLRRYLRLTTKDLMTLPDEHVYGLLACWEADNKLRQEKLEAEMQRRK